MKNPGKFVQHPYRENTYGILYILKDDAGNPIDIVNTYDEVIYRVFYPGNEDDPLYRYTIGDGLTIIDTNRIVAQYTPEQTIEMYNKQLYYELIVTFGGREESLLGDRVLTRNVQNNSGQNDFALELNIDIETYEITIELGDSAAIAVQAAAEAEAAAAIATGAVAAIEQARDDALVAIGTAETDALTAINTARDAGVQAVQDAATQGVQAVEAVRDAAIAAINVLVTQAQQAAQTATTKADEASDSEQASAENASDAEKQAQETGPFTDSGGTNYDNGAKGYRNQTQVLHDQTENLVETFNVILNLSQLHGYDTLIGSGPLSIAQSGQSWTNWNESFTRTGFGASADVNTAISVIQMPELNIFGRGSWNVKCEIYTGSSAGTTGGLIIGADSDNYLRATIDNDTLRVDKIISGGAPENIFSSSLGDSNRQTRKQISFSQFVRSATDHRVSVIEQLSGKGTDGWVTVGEQGIFVGSRYVGILGNDDTLHTNFHVNSIGRQ